MPFLGTYLYTPDVALGRLVESPEDIAAVIDQFLTPAAGRRRPRRAAPEQEPRHRLRLHDDDGQRDQGHAQRCVTPGQVQALISDDVDQRPTSTTRSRAPRRSPTSSRPTRTTRPTRCCPPTAAAACSPPRRLVARSDPTSPAGSCSRWAATPASASATSSRPSGNASDWPEAMLGRGAAAFVGNTGFGIGLRDTVAFSARITADFAKNMAEMPLGTALAQAKRDYLGGGTPNVYDYKVMAEATYFGLPMFHLPGAHDGPRRRRPGPPPPTRTTGLTSVDITTSQPVSSAAWELDRQRRRQLLAARSARLARHRAEPSYPAEADLRRHPAGPRGPRRDTSPACRRCHSRTFDPALARIVVGEAANEHELAFGDVIFPTAQQSITRSRRRAGLATTSCSIPAHFEVDTARNPVTGVETPVHQDGRARALQSDSQHRPHAARVPQRQRAEERCDGQLPSRRGRSGRRHGDAT